MDWYVILILGKLFFFLVFAPCIIWYLQMIYYGPNVVFFYLHIYYNISLSSLGTVAWMNWINKLSVYSVECVSKMKSFLSSISYEIHGAMCYRTHSSVIFVRMLYFILLSSNCKYEPLANIWGKVMVLYKANFMFLFSAGHSVLAPCQDTEAAHDHRGQTIQFNPYYRQTSDISRTSVCNELVDHLDAVGASSVGAVPTTSSFST